MKKNEKLKIDHDLYYYLLQSGVKKIFRKYLYPNLEDFSIYEMSDAVSVLIRSTLKVSEIPIDIENEFLELNEILRRRYENLDLNYPRNYSIGRNTAFLLYAFVRLYKPETIVETGVANGHSTYLMLNAIKNNQRGSLWSIDVNDNVGILLNDEDRNSWNLYILQKKNRKNELREFLLGMNPIDLFLHDSNHFYYWQMCEYEAARSSIRNGGYLMTDDADASFAFIDFCKKYSVNPFFLVDYRKIFGIAKM